MRCEPVECYFSEGLVRRTHKPTMKEQKLWDIPNIDGQYRNISSDLVIPTESDEAVMDGGIPKTTTVRKNLAKSDSRDHTVRIKPYIEKVLCS